MTEGNDPLNDFLKDVLSKRQKRMDAHTALRESHGFKDAIARVDRLIADYGVAINAIDLMATRSPPFFQKLITLRLKQQFVESMIATAQAIKAGLHNPAHRELRFLLEASIKTLWLDSGCPLIGNAPKSVAANVDEKVASLDDLGRERFGEVIASLRFRMIDEAGAFAYRQTANSLYTSLSTHVHISSRVIARDLKGFDRDRDIGFETIGDVNKVVDLMRQVLDLALASHFEAFDAGLVGDIFIHVLDDEKRWSFHKTSLVSAVSRHFDYKAERQPGWKSR